VNEFQGIPETPEGIREFRINEECFHGMPLILLLSLFHLQVALNGFHSLDLPDFCYNPFLSPFVVMYQTIENNISICSTSYCYVGSCLTCIY
jgi:hypothetical protein